MKYLVTIEGFDNLIEEEIIINIDGQQLRCFMPYGSSIQLEIGKQYHINLEADIYGELEIKEVGKSVKEIKCINQTFAYYISGILDIDNSKIESTIDIYLEKEFLYDYGFLDDKYVEFKVDRFNVEFDAQ
ncbi:hypothetical protein [Acetivibrio cellulolyticus]|uniref:hypothetical protein n=1 Tax=Acetivibrio cellulolyticus TaxID=35830 RepID=UPI0001E2CCE4|nr:hypothetical protein [Acetivibrio cellulolyticus]